MKKVLVVLAEGFEELEAVTVMDLLVRAGVNVTRASLTPGPVQASRNTVIVPDTTLDNVIDEAFDAIVLPGGLPGADHLAKHSALLTRLQQQVGANKIVAAICAAPRALVAAGIVEGKTITCFPGALKAFDHLASQNTTVSDKAIEVDLPLITSRGPGTAMDFALTLIQQLIDEKASKEIEAQMAR